MLVLMMASLAYVAEARYNGNDNDNDSDELLYAGADDG